MNPVVIMILTTKRTTTTAKTMLIMTIRATAIGPDTVVMKAKIIMTIKILMMVLILTMIIVSLAHFTGCVDGYYGLGCQYQCGDGW